MTPFEKLSTHVHAVGKKRDNFPVYYKSFHTTVSPFPTTWNVSVTVNVICDLCKHIEHRAQQLPDLFIEWLMFSWVFVWELSVFCHPLPLVFSVTHSLFTPKNRIELFYLSHTRLYRDYITSSEMYSLHLTHPKWTHTRSSGQPCYGARGAVGGSVPCSMTPQSWYWRRRERWLFTPSPTIPAGPEIRTHNLWITSPTL